MTALRSVDAEALPAVAWRNGRGTARTLAAWPPDATDSLGSDAFAWRVGIAEIEPGRVPFSRFPGIDRVLVATGPGLALGAAGDGASMRAVEPFLPFAFDGDAAVEALLVGERLRVFNVMARRGSARGSAAVHRRSAPIADGATTVLWCVRGRAAVSAADGETTSETVPLPTGAAAVVSDGRATLHIDGDGADTVVLAATLHA